MIPILGSELSFPNPMNATHDGIVAIGGDLSPERLLLAYRNGIFPWFNEGDPIIWWSLNPRMVVFPEKLKVSKSMRPYFNQNKYRVTYDQHFDIVINACANVKRRNQTGTWITDQMLEAYVHLHQLGYAHSVEVWEANRLVGGLYGVAVGQVFCGESMFSHSANASKFGFISLVNELKAQGCKLIDCQQETNHLRSLGGETISRFEFTSLINQYASEPDILKF